jgi:hypothetical protein
VARPAFSGPRRTASRFAPLAFCPAECVARAPSPGFSFARFVRHAAPPAFRSGVWGVAGCRGLGGIYIVGGWVPRHKPTGPIEIYFPVAPCLCSTSSSLDKPPVRVVYVGGIWSCLTGQQVPKKPSSAVKKSQKPVVLSAQEIAAELRLASDHDPERPRFLSYNFGVAPTRLDPKGPYYKEDVVAALLSTEFNLGRTAQLLGRSRASLSNYVASHADVKEVYDDAREALIDDAEHTVSQSLRRGDSTDARYVLSTLGKDRGYTTRQETTGKDGGPQKIDISVKFRKPAGAKK